METRLAKSKAGHDKGRFYVVLKEEEEYVYLADGIFRLSARPKKKNRKHVQIVKKIPEPVEGILCQKEVPSDEELKRALKIYEKSIKKCAGCGAVDI